MQRDRGSRSRLAAANAAAQEFYAEALESDGGRTGPAVPDRAELRRRRGAVTSAAALLGAVRDGRLDHDYLPPSLRDVLLARAELLSPSAQHVLRVASAGGRWVPDRLLALVAELPGPELNAGLREAVEQQLLVVDATGRGFGFRHELARAAIHEDLLPGERAQLHKAYAEAIEDTPELAGADLDAVSMLAYHWLAAHDLPGASRIGAGGPRCRRGMGAFGGAATLRARPRAVEPGTGRRTARRRRSLRA